MRQQAYEVLDGLIKSNSSSSRGNNENSVYIINAENGEHLGASGNSYKLYSAITNKLIQEGDFTFEQFKETFGMSFIDFYNNINAIQISNIHGGIGGGYTSMVYLDGKLHEIITEDEITGEFYYTSFNKTKVMGYLKGVFSVDIVMRYVVSTAIPEPMIAVDIDIIDDDEVG